MAGLGLGTLLVCLQKNDIIFSWSFVLFFCSIPCKVKWNTGKTKHAGKGKPTNEALTLLCQSHSEMPKELKRKFVQMRILLWRSSDASGWRLEPFRVSLIRNESQEFKSQPGMSFCARSGKATKIIALSN